MLKYFYIFGTLAFTLYGQLILKWRIGFYGALPEPTIEKVLFLIKLLIDPYIFSGLGAALVASFFWMAAMTKFDLSFAYPLMTAGLVLFTVAMAILFLGESLTMSKVLAVLLIISGVVLLIRTA